MLTCARQNKGLRRVRPLQLERGGQRRDPDLPDRRVWGYDEFGWGLLEQDVERARVLLGLEVTLAFGTDQALLQRGDGLIGEPPELVFIKHGASLASGQGYFEHSTDDGAGTPRAADHCSSTGL